MSVVIRPGISQDLSAGAAQVLTDWDGQRKSPDW
jgi:hypothetical protein